MESYLISPKIPTPRTPECAKWPGVLLWVAHYTHADHPATPMNLPWTIWQNAGNGRVLGCGDQDIDCNVFDDAHSDLPVLGTGPDSQPTIPDTPASIDEARVKSQVAETLAGEVRDFFGNDDDPKGAA